MKKCLFLLLLPLIGLSQSGISISGLSQFNTGESIVPINNTFAPIAYDLRNTKVTLSIFRGRKFTFGTIALKGSVAYNIDKVYFYAKNSINIPNYEVTTRSLMPGAELWYIVFQNENTFLYTSIGSFATIENLNIDQKNTQLDEDLYKNNELIPFIRAGLQLNYGRVFINPFISFDLPKIEFEQFDDIFEYNLIDGIKNYDIRTGLEFGIMF